jgi:tetratricopeptide (TPR) repeat protein
MKSFILKRALPPLLAALAGVFLLAPAGATLQGLQVGAEAPDFRLKTLAGEPGDFAGLRGDKLTIVLFWATWSRSSEAALTRMEELYRRYRGEGLGVIAVNANGQTLTQETKEEVIATAKRLDLTFPLLFDDRLRTFHDFGVIALPTLAVLSPERTIRYEMSGYPLMGVGEMVDFVTATLEGRGPSPRIAEKTGYRPDSRALHFFNMGRKTLKSRRMMNTAEMWFKKAIEADDRFAEPRLSLGRFYLARREYDKAAEQFTRVLAQDPENVVALCEGAMLLDGQGRPGEAITMLEKARRKDPYYTPCYYYLGYLTGREGSLEEALPLFEQALEINRASADIPLHKGRMYEERQEPERAAESYRRALEALLGET